MSDELTPAQKLRLALELYEDGVAIKRESLRRKLPEASDQEIEARLDAWLRERPPDADGQLVSWPRRR